MRRRGRRCSRCRCGHRRRRGCRRRAERWCRGNACRRRATRNAAGKATTRSSWKAATREAAAWTSARRSAWEATSGSGLREHQVRCPNQPRLILVHPPANAVGEPGGIRRQEIRGLLQARAREDLADRGQRRNGRFGAAKRGGRARERQRRVERQSHVLRRHAEQMCKIFARGARLQPPPTAVFGRSALHDALETACAARTGPQCGRDVLQVISRGWFRRKNQREQQRHELRDDQTAEQESEDLHCQRGSAPGARAE